MKKIQAYISANSRPAKAAAHKAIGKGCNYQDNYYGDKVCIACQQVK